MGDNTRLQTRKSWVLLILVFAFFSLNNTFCDSVNNNNSSNADAERNSGNDATHGTLKWRAGKQLAATHCQSCHMLPDPGLLDKENWKIALGMMAPRLGIYYHNGQPYTIFTDIDQDFYPSKPAMNSSDWQQVIDYYIGEAPSHMPPAERKVVKTGLPFFSLKFPAEYFYRHGNTASFIKIDTSVKPRRIFVNRSVSNTLFLVNENLGLIDSLQTNGPIVDIDIHQNELTACIIGADLFGNNARVGNLLPLRIANGQLMKATKTSLVDSLARPVQITSVDLNGDNRRDYLVCEFGNMTGSLLWLKNQGKGKYLPHKLRPLPGATQVHVQDYNHDGLPDIWAQFAQGEEGIFLFTNKGNDVFQEEQVLRLPPTYGSSSFELDDFNGDGFVDLLYTCGDRGDGVNQLKPYHGVYIYVNNGKNKFSKEYFFPINGCIKAMAEDFDSDGDLDIASIGFFTDNDKPEEGFTYLQNNGNFDFQPYSLPLDARFYKATTMDVADIDGDGKQDILLGHGFIGNKAMDDKKPLFILLQNRF